MVWIEVIIIIGIATGLIACWGIYQAVLKELAQQKYKNFIMYEYRRLNSIRR